MAKLTSYSASRMFGRRSFMRSAAYAAAAPALKFLAGPAKASNWRGLVGCIKPTVNSFSRRNDQIAAPRDRDCASLSQFYRGHTAGNAE
jgi:hypothetical protein